MLEAIGLESGSVWSVTLLIATVTAASRLAGPVIMRVVPITGWIERFLDGVAISVIAAMVASRLSQQGAREAAAVGVAGIVMIATRSPVAAMILGIATGAAWTALLGR